MSKKIEKNLEIKMLEVNKIIPYINNPRDNTSAIDKVAGSIKEFGFKVPIVIDCENVIVTGHTRYEASKKLGLEVVPCIIASDLTPTQIKAFRIADNKVSEYAEWDEELLKVELESLKELNYDYDFEFDFLDEEVEIDLDDFFEEDTRTEEEKKTKEIQCPHCNMYFKV